jgi:cytochrome c
MASSSSSPAAENRLHPPPLARKALALDQGRATWETRSLISGETGGSTFMRVILASTAILLAVSAAVALSPAEQRGLTFAEANCALCHAIGQFGESPLPIAPPFRTIGESRDIDQLHEPLHTGTITEDPSMPHFLLDAAQISDLIAYLHTLDPNGE